MHCHRTVALTLAVAAVVATAAVSPTVAAPTGGEAPGERLGGVVTLQGGTVDGTVTASTTESRLESLEGDDRRRFVERRLDAVEAKIGAMQRRDESMAVNGSTDGMPEFAADGERVRASLRALGNANMSPEHRERHTALRQRLDGDWSTTAEQGVARLEGASAGGMSPLELADVRAATARGLDDAPDGLYRIVAAERVELHLRSSDGSTATYHGTVEERELHDAGTGASDDATLRVRADAATFRRIRAADAPARVLREALADGRIRYRGVGPANRVQYAALDAARFGATSVQTFLDVATDAAGW